MEKNEWIAFREDEKWQEKQRPFKGKFKQTKRSNKAQFQQIGKTMARPNNAKKLL